MLGQGKTFIKSTQVVLNQQMDTGVNKTSSTLPDGGNSDPFIPLTLKNSEYVKV